MPCVQHTLPQVAFEREPGAASAPLPSGYVRREPEKSALYQVAAQHLETFLDEPLRHGAAPYPRYVEREFRRYLDCGIPCRGFARLICESCGSEHLVAFSCKGAVVPVVLEQAGRRYRRASGRPHPASDALPAVRAHRAFCAAPLHAA